MKTKREIRNYDNVVDFSEIRRVASSLGVKGLGKKKKSLSKKGFAILAKGLEKSKDYDSAIKTMLKVILSTVSMAEENYKQLPSDRNAYALNTLIEAAKGLISELESRSSKKKLLERIQPLLKFEGDNLIRQVTMSIGMLRKSIYDTLPQKSRTLADNSVKVLLEEVGKALKVHYSNLSEKITENLNN
jgi:hypothetical protein